jgi:multidrug efflux pump subunit AcrB
LELTPVENRTRPSPVILEAIRDASGDLSEAELVAFEEVDGGPAGPDITFEARGDDEESVNHAVEEIKAALGEYEGVYGIYDSDVAAQRELKVTLLPGATSLGFSVGDVAQQVRGAILGLEAHVFSDRREDISVRVSLDEAGRRKLSSVEDMWVISPTGQGVPLREIASIRDGDSLAVVRRINRTRAVVITANTESHISPESITADIAARIKEIDEAHPNVIITSGGRQQDLYDALATLPYAGGAAALMIYVVLAWLFASYVQPIAVMLAIPFGAIGVVWGHFLLGYDLTFLSLIGFVALAGIVVNNSLILVEFFNRNCREGMDMKPALVDAGRRRLRPIVLTTATTILGLTPLMLEQSFQAQFLIPMAISITCGLASSTVLTLLVLPAILVIVDDLVGAAHWLWFGRTRPPRSEVPEGI